MGRRKMHRTRTTPSVQTPDGPRLVHALPQSARPRFAAEISLTVKRLMGTPGALGGGGGAFWCIGPELPGRAGLRAAGPLGPSFLADSTTGSASSATPCAAAGRCPVARRLQCACGRNHTVHALHQLTCMSCRDTCRLTDPPQAETYTGAFHETEQPGSNSL